MLAVDAPSLAVGDAVAAGLRCRGVTTEVMEFSHGVPVSPLTADLIVVGLGLVSGEVVGARAVRSWLASVAPEAPGQLAAAFNVRTGWAVAPGQLTAGAACRVLSASGFHLADLSMTFPTFGDEVTERADRERSRAEEWGRALANTVCLSLIAAASPA